MSFVPADDAIKGMLEDLLAFDAAKATAVWGRLSTTPFTPATAKAALSGYDDFRTFVRDETVAAVKSGALKNWPLVPGPDKGQSRTVELRNGMIAVMRTIVDDALGKISVPDQEEVLNKAPIITGFNDLVGKQGFTVRTDGPKPSVSIGHFLGSCIDLPSTKSPYLIGEFDDGPINSRLADTYNLVASLTRPGKRDFSVVSILYKQPSDRGEFKDIRKLIAALQEESDLFKEYFPYLNRPAGDLLAYARRRARDAGLELLTPRSIDPYARPPLTDPTDDRVMALGFKDDLRFCFISLTENYFEGGVDKTRAAPYLDDRHPDKTSALWPGPGRPGTDRPFKGIHPHDGFMDWLPKEFLFAARTAGLDWGGSDLGPASGDLMHFQLSSTDPYVAWVKDSIIKRGLG